MSAPLPGQKWDPQKQDWVDEYDPFPAQVTRPSVFGLWVGLALVIAVLVAAGVLLNIVGEGRESPQGPSAPPSASTVGPSPSPAPIDPDQYEQGLAEAIAHVAATEPDTEKGRARVSTITGSLVFVTDGRCEVSSVDMETFRRRRAGGDYVVRKVRYAPPEWKDQFVGVRVEVTCT